MYKVLIVDDEKLLREGLRHMIDWTKTNFSIVGDVSNGEQALQIIKEVMPDIVVADVRMPIMDGITLTKEIKKQFPYIHVIILSSYNDFDYVREALRFGASDYLLKPQVDSSSMLASLNRVSQMILKEDVIPVQENHQILSNLFSQENGPIWAATLEKAGCVFHYPQAVMVLTKLQNDLQMLNVQMINNAILHKSPKASVYSFSPKSNCIFTIFSSENTELESPERILKYAISMWENGEKPKFNILYTHPFHINDDFRMHYKRLKKAEPYLFYLHQGTICNCDFVKQYLKFPNIDLNKMQMPINMRTYVECLQYIRSEIDFGINEGCYYHPCIVKKIYIDLFQRILSVNQLSLTSEKECRDLLSEVLMDIDNIWSYDSLIEYLSVGPENVFKNTDILFCKKAPLRLIQLIETTQFQKYGSTLSEIISYISTHYDQNITLAKISNKFHVNKSYLCQLFQKKIGMSFNQYIMIIRINKAKELLQLKKNNINEVCTQVGYSSPSYFTRHFRKLVGITPSEYVAQLSNSSLI